MSDIKKTSGGNNDAAQSEKSLVEVTPGSTLQPSNGSRMAVSSRVQQACAIEIRNHHKDVQLVSPAYFLYSGYNQAPPPSIISPGHAEACLFRKKFFSSYGSTGVLTYNIMRIPEKFASEEETTQLGVETGMTLALLWSIPVMQRSIQAIGVMPRAPADRKLYNEMINNSKEWFSRDVAGSPLRFETLVDGILITVLGSMSTVGQATWTVDIC